MPSRRRFLLSSIALPSQILGAQSNPVVVGLLLPGNDEYASQQYDGLARELRALGYAKDRLNIVVRAGGEQGLAALAEELARLRVTLVITAGTNASLTARRAMPTTPLVFYSVADPIGSGLADNLARPGRNSTGLTNFSGQLLTAKRVELLRQLLPNLARIAYLWNPVTGDPQIGPSIRDLGNSLNLATLVVQARTPNDLESAFKSIVEFKAQAVIIQVDTFFEDVRTLIAERLATTRLPSMFGEMVYVAAGGLMSYGADETDNARKVAIYVDKILRGARPDNIPIQQPTRFEFAINHRTSAKLGLAVPSVLRLQASRVIE